MCLLVRSAFFRKKEKLAEIATRCHWLSLVVPLAVIRCHSLSLVVTRYITRLSFLNDGLNLSSFNLELKVCSKTYFSRNSYHEETSYFICIANHLTGFRII